MGVSEKFVYDSTGNIIQLDDIVLKYSASDRLHRRGDMQYLYDGNGRLIKKIEDCENQTPKVWLFEWDAEDQLRKVTTPVGEIWEYKYDALGRRIVKQGPTKVIRLVWNGDVIVHQLENKKVLHSSWVFDPYSFVPLCKVQNEQLYSVICDHLGTPRELLDIEGKVVWSVSYKAWGEVEEVQVKEVDCPIRFQGQWADEESGLCYNRFRYYEAQSGRFVSGDPIRLLGGLNSYLHGDNPINWLDPLGLSGSDMITVWHFTDKKGFNAITSGKNITIKVSEPPGGNPKGAYFSKLSPQELGNTAAKTLRIPRRKTEYVIEVQVPKNILKEKGGRHRAIVYSTEDVKVKEGNWKGGKNSCSKG